ncbi:MAG TPA: GNAT family N-acetyltransferase [Candidatus Binataceae bacterium]|nr:GNAT family N-acetyltransferase [Candidatus Binataceae bacterium]
MEVRAALPSERDEVLDLLALWYNDRAFFERYNHNDPGFRDALCLIARDAGAIVSTVQIFDRAINLDGAAVPMGGIGSVFTREDYRHQRVASALMRLAVETLAREGFELSLLFAERLTFYNQFGWREVGRKFGVLADAAALKTATDLEIDVFDLERDLAEVAEIHRAYTGRFNVSAVRGPSQWRANYSFAGNQPMHPGEGSEEYFVLARGGASIRAYARAIRLYGVTMVMEYGYRPQAEDALFALLRHLAQAAQGGASSFRLRGDHRRAARLRPGPGSGLGATAPTGAIITHTAHDRHLEDRLAAAGAPVMHHIDNNYMWRIIAPGKLAARFGTTPEAAAERAYSIFADDRSLFWTADRF